MTARFKFNFNQTHLNKMIPSNPDTVEWYRHICEILPKWNITTIPQVVGFLSQCAHESADFTRLRENFNYSATRLNEIFPKYFVRAGRNAQDYNRKPEKIANLVYANRMGNGNEESGDGWRYRGGGLIQLTGKDNYHMVAKELHIPIEDIVEYVQSKYGALESACLYWDKHNLNKYCDDQDIKGLTKAINGGFNGLDDRTHKWNRYMSILFDKSHNFNQIVKQGSTGYIVEKIQAELGLKVDGIFGPITEQKLKQWQQLNGLVVDGIAGPNTLQVLLK